MFYIFVGIKTYSANQRIKAEKDFQFLNLVPRVVSFVRGKALGTRFSRSCGKRNNKKNRLKILYCMSWCLFVLACEKFPCLGHIIAEQVTFERNAGLEGDKRRKTSSRVLAGLASIANHGRFHSTKIPVLNFQSSTCPMEQYIPVAHTRRKPPRVWLLFS